MRPSLFHDRMFMVPVLHRCYVGNHSHYEFMSTAAMPYSEEAFTSIHPHPTIFIFFLLPLLKWSLDLGGSDIDAPSGTDHSAFTYSQHCHQLGVSALNTTHCKRSFQKHSEVISVTYSFSWSWVMMTSSSIRNKEPWLSKNVSRVGHSPNE